MPAMPWAALLLVALAGAGAECSLQGCEGGEDSEGSLLQMRLQDGAESKPRGDRTLVPTRLRSGAGSESRGVRRSAVADGFSLTDADSGLPAWPPPPALLQSGGNALARLRASKLQLRFQAHGQAFDFELQRAPSVFAPGATATVLTDAGAVERLVGQRHIFRSEGHDAVLTAVGSSIRGLVRQNDTFFDLETEEDSMELLTVDELSLEVPERWTNCYPHDDATHSLYMGYAVTYAIYKNVCQSSEQKCLDFMETVFSKANMIYTPQLNFVLMLKKPFMVTDKSSAPAWENAPNCRQLMNKQLVDIQRWEVPEKLALWHYLDDCYDGDQSGMSETGTICKSERSPASYANGDLLYHNNQITWYSGREMIWQAFAHEVGHAFGASHSFEEGQGTTGGIMDYDLGFRPDRRLDGVWQFNTQYRKLEICAEITRALTEGCSYIAVAKNSTSTGEEKKEKQCRGKYSVSRNARATCRRAKANIKTASECACAASKLGYTFKGRINKRNRQTGCITTGRSGSVFFNRASKGKKHPRTWVVCKAR